jgi:hypothetical protein
MAQAYTAKFTDGREKRIAKSAREYTAAWQLVMVHKGKESVSMGFARDHGMAKAAIRREIVVYGKDWTLVRTEVVDAQRAEAA